MPSGTELTYQAAEQVIEAVAESKARQFRRIAWLDADDIRQEVRLKCSLTLGRFDPTKSDLHTFLSRCAENRLRDIKRGVLYKHNKPCFRCPLWNEEASRAGRHDCMAFADKMECDKYAKHERYVHAKLSASHPVNIDEGRMHDTTFDRAVAKSDLIECIYAKLTREELAIFVVFERSNFNLRSLRPRDRTIICEAIVKILEQYQEDRDV